jgi:glycosyltransferase involved in cell wall biosynthesis
MGDDITPLRIEHLPVARRVLRVAVVADRFRPDDLNDAAGAAFRIGALARRDHQIHLVRPGADPQASVPGDPARAVPARRGLGAARPGALVLGSPAKRHLVQLWTVRRPDVVHVLVEEPLGWIALQVARKLRLPVVTEFRVQAPPGGRPARLSWPGKSALAARRKFHNQGLATIVPTPSLARGLSASGFRNVHLLPRGVDTVRFQRGPRSAELRAQWGAADTDAVVLLAGDATAGVAAGVVEAVRRRNARTRFAGVTLPDGLAAPRDTDTGPDPACRAAEARRALEMRSADVLLVTGHAEAYAAVVLEAMASGLPVVAFGGTPAGEVVEHERSGLLAGWGDPAELTAMVAELTADAARRQALGALARQQAVSQDWELITGRLEALLLTAAGLP